MAKPREVKKAKVNILDKGKELGSKVIQTGKKIGDTAIETSKKIGGKVADTSKDIGGKVVETSKVISEKVVETSKDISGKVVETGKDVGGKALETSKELGGKAMETGGKAFSEAKLNAEIFALENKIRISKIKLGDMIYQVDANTKNKEIEDIKKLIKNCLGEIEKVELKRSKEGR